MACCLCFFQGSKPCVVVAVLAIPIFALFAIFSSAFLIPITLSLIFIMFSTLFPFTISKQKANMVLNETPIAENNKFSPREKMVENTLIAETLSDDDLGYTITRSPTGKINGSGFTTGPQDLSFYSESESLDPFSTSEEEDHFSDTEWPYNVSQMLECSDDSISDEESLFEIALPSGQFVSQDLFFKYDDLKCCSKLCADNKDFLADINEDNLIEIDIYMGSIKCSKLSI